MQCAARSKSSAPGSAAGGACRRALSALALLLALLLVLLAPPAARAEDRIAVTDARLALATNGGDPGVVLNADFEFELPWVLEDAVNRGVALYFVVDFELFRTRWYWFDRRQATASLTWRLTYSPLTRQYRLARGALAQPFDTLGEALAIMRRVRGWQVLDRGVLRPDEDYRAQVRMRLDTSQLPKPFQINALTNRDWTLASDWRSLDVPAELAR